MAIPVRSFSVAILYPKRGEISAEQHNMLQSWMLPYGLMPPLE